MQGLFERYRAFISRGKNAQYLLFLTAIFFSFIFLGKAPIDPWDEALHGELAYQMLLTSDFVNYHYGGVPEYWFAKPPLSIWSIAASFKIFGFNTFALRFPSALAICLTILVVFKIIRLYADTSFAFHVGLLLISINGLIGPHVGRSGDTDAMLVLFLCLANWQFLKFIDFQKKPAALYAGLFLGLAFLVKGPAAFIFIPGWLLYLMWSQRFINYLKNFQLYLIAIGPILAIALWVIPIQTFGAEYVNNPHGGKNAFQTMLNYDLKHRFIEEKSESNGIAMYLSFFRVLDAKFAIWVYLAYAGTLLVVFRKKWHDTWGNVYQRLHIFFLLLVSSGYFFKYR